MGEENHIKHLLNHTHERESEWTWDEMVRRERRWGREETGRKG